MWSDTTCPRLIKNNEEKKKSLDKFARGSWHLFTLFQESNFTMGKDRWTGPTFERVFSSGVTGRRPFGATSVKERTLRPGFRRGTRRNRSTVSLSVYVDAREPDRTNRFATSFRVHNARPPLPVSDISWPRGGKTLVFALKINIFSRLCRLNLIRERSIEKTGVFMANVFPFSLQDEYVCKD